MPHIKKRQAFQLFWFFPLLLWLVACQGGLGRAVPTPFPTATPSPIPSATPSPAPTETPAGTIRHPIPAGNFSLLLPAGWVVVDQGLTTLGHQYLVGPEPVGPGPSSSAIFVAPAGDLTAQMAADALQCGRATCQNPTLTPVTINGIPAQKATLASQALPPLNWYFLEHDGQLIFLSLHDPVTLSDRMDLLETITFEDIPIPTSTAPPTPIPSPTPVPTLDAVKSWRRVSVADAGISFEVPAGWTQPDDTLTWSPSRSAPFSLHFAWTPITEASGQPADLLPAGTDLAAGEPLTLAWAPAASRYPLDQPDQAAIYVLIPAGDRAYAFHILAPSPATLPQIEPVLAHALDSVQIDFVIETYLPEPTDAAVGFFQAVIADPAGKSALPFLSPTLRSTIPAGEPPITLLNLSDRLVEFNLDWAFSASRSVTVSALLQTADGRTTERILTLVLLDDLGWRIDAIAEADE